MMRKVFTAKDFESLDTVTYTNVAVIYSKVIDENMKQCTSMIDGNVQVTSDGITLVEVEDGAIDIATNVGKFAIGADGRLKLIVDKAKVNTIDLAKTELAKCVALYKLRDGLKYEDDLYDITMINEATGQSTFNTVLLSGDKMLAYIRNNVTNIDLDATDCISFRILPKLKQVT